MPRTNARGRVRGQNFGLKASLSSGTPLFWRKATPLFWLLTVTLKYVHSCETPQTYGSFNKRIEFSRRNLPVSIFLPKLAANNGSFTGVNALAMYFMRKEVQLILRTLVITTCTADTGYIISVCSYSVAEQIDRCAMAKQTAVMWHKNISEYDTQKTSHDSIKSRTRCGVESYPVCCFATQ